MRFLEVASIASVDRSRGPFRQEDRLIRVAPFALVTILAGGLTLVPGAPAAHDAGDHSGLLIATAVLACITLMAALITPWDRISPQWQGLPLLTFLLTLALLRQAQSDRADEYIVLFMVPIVGLALYSPLWQLIAGFVVTVVMLIQPIDLGLAETAGENITQGVNYPMIILFVCVLAFVATALRIAGTAAGRDPLTGIPNRRVFMSELRNRSAHASRHGQTVSVALLDLDYFKAYNDAHGHDAGDSLLRRTAMSWQSLIREGDLLARIGGEEFGLIADRTPEETAIVAERLIHSVPDGQSASAGIAGVAPGGHPDPLDAFRRADHALYSSKANGRGRVSMAEPTA